MFAAAALAACSLPSRPPPHEPPAAATNPAPVEARAPLAIALGTGSGWRFKGMAIDSAGRFAVLASWDRKRLLRIDLVTGEQTPISTPYDGRLAGLGVTQVGDRVYAVMNAIDDDASAHALSVLLVLDAGTLEVLQAHELRAAGPRHHFNHVAVDRRGRAYVTDTLHAAIHVVDTLDPRAPVTRLVHDPSLDWVHGIDLSPAGDRLFVTAYGGGIRIFDLERGAFTAYSDPSTAGDDGLRYHAGSLYAVGQNMIRRHVLDPSLSRVVRTEIVLAQHPAFNDPRDLQVVGDRIYCLANIELAPVAFDDASPLRAPLTDSHVVVLPLPAAEPGLEPAADRS